MSETYKLNRIGLEVMKTDLGEMTWDKAKEACKNLGNDWRLPTKEEFNTIYKYKDRIGGFTTSDYWSSTEDGGSGAWLFDFYVGFANRSGGKEYPYYVRAVRDL
jgi:hypothetical protein